MSRFNILGTLTLNVDVVVLLTGTVPPILIPVTVGVVARVNVLPSADIPVTSLKTGVLAVPSLNDIIAPVWIPTFPAKLRLTAVAAVPTHLFDPKVKNQIIYDHIILHLH